VTLGDPKGQPDAKLRPVRGQEIKLTPRRLKDETNPIINLKISFNSINTLFGIIY